MWKNVGAILTGKTNQSKKHLSHCHFVHNKSYTDLPATKPWSLRLGPED